MATSQLAEFLTSELPVPFAPKPFYEERTDSLIFYARNERSYSKRLNAMFTLFLSAEDDSLVGCEIKGVKRLLRHLGDFGVLVRDDRIDLAILIAVATASPAEEREAGEIYERVRCRLKSETENVPVPQELVSA